MRNMRLYLYLEDQIVVEMIQWYGFREILRRIHLVYLCVKPETSDQTQK